jgi:hypothetical protein
MPSLYGFAKKQDATNTRKMSWWVALDFIFYNELKTTIPLDKWPSNTK